jgi:hypothetical protein
MGVATDAERRKAVRIHAAVDWSVPSSYWIRGRVGTVNDWRREYEHTPRDSTR